MQTFDVLVVEDNPADAELMHEGFSNMETSINLHHACDGERALKFLRREPPHDAAPRPALVLLDLNLPRRDGKSVLAEVRDDDAICRIPIIVISSSATSTDVSDSYELGANCYIQKPIGFGEFERTLRSIEDFWFQCAELPI